ncbi:MAG: asparagine synthetase B, partial [Candidatus ainarchaeum sp.]|nr:asparagine synthetase B [Candidatus ainarchaeum sp.]
MCGIAAIFGPNVNPKILKKSLSRVKHRGFSLFESLYFPTCALGCNRLEIVDRDNAVQPVSNEDNTVFAVLNGEIFNFNSLTKELIEKGHLFKTASDSEVLVHLYEEYGKKMCSKIDSEMFAFFIFDRKKNAFFACRDPYGVKPLYYAIDSKKNFHFASEIKQLAQFKEIKEIFSFPPGNYMQNCSLTKYHSIPFPVKTVSLKKSISKLRALFDSAIKKRLDTDLPIAVFFSGGIDSAAVLETARKFHSSVSAVIVGFPSSPDVVFAKRFCNEKNIPFFYSSPPKESELAKIIPKIVFLAETFEPNIIRNSAVSYLISKTAREHGFRLAFCGEGPDELFAGYPEFQSLSPSAISKKISCFIQDLPRTQFQRVDRTSMHFTIETRIPFFDTAFA